MINVTPVEADAAKERFFEALADEVEKAMREIADNITAADLMRVDPGFVPSSWMAL